MDLAISKVGSIETTIENFFSTSNNSELTIHVQVGGMQYDVGEAKFVQSFIR